MVTETGRGGGRNRGGVVLLRPNADGSFEVSRSLTGLDHPHGIALHGGEVWVAGSDRIVRAPYPSMPPRASEATVVVEGLPGDGRHQRKTLGWGPDGRLYFSVGLATDNCDGANPCVEGEGDDPRVARGVVARWDPRTRRASVFARGLRNNLGFAWHPTSGFFWGVENARDYIDRQDPSLSDALLPHEELNELVEGGRYGWPWCYDDGVTSPEYARGGGRDCRDERNPAMLLPAHASPISIMFYTGEMFPAEWRGRAFVTYHGYRANGHRVVTIPFEEDGRPTGVVENFITGWEERPGRPHGHLTGIAQGRDGALYLSDDVGGVVYRIAYGESARTVATAVVAPLTETPAEVEARCAEVARRRDRLSEMQRVVIDTKCVSCHGAAAGGLLLRRCDWRGSFESLVHGRSLVTGEPYVVPGDIGAGVLLARLRGGGAALRMPPPPLALTAEELATVERWVRSGAGAP